MSPNSLWASTAPGSTETYKPNNIDANRGVSAYIGKALKKDGLNTVVSFIPDAMIKSQESVRKSEKAVRDVKRAANIQAIISVVAVCGLIISCVGFSLNALNKANDRYDTLKEEYESIKVDYAKQIDALESRIDELIESIEDDGTGDSTDEPNANATN